MPGTNLFSSEEKDALGNRVALTDETGAFLFVRGATIPPDATVGYSKGCIFIDTEGEGGAILFLNEGTATSSDFNSITTGL